MLGLDTIVFLQHEIWTGPFQQDLYKMSVVQIIIDDQSGSFCLAAESEANSSGGGSTPSTGGKNLLRMIDKHAWHSAIVTC
jgi:hypothetical protein